MAKCSFAGRHFEHKGGEFGRNFGYFAAKQRKRKASVVKLQAVTVVVA